MITLKNGMLLTLRKAKKEDAAAIIPYLNQVGGESDNLLFGKNEFRLTIADEEAFIERLEGSQTSALFIGLIEDEIVCVLSLMASPKPRIAHQADIALSVKKKFWHMGIATAAMQHAIEFARESGQIEILHLGVRADNERAISVYERAGFTRIGLYPKFFKINGAYCDEILMNLYI
jgi:Acetyltransferases, including N-acetylases of ribosomal proteins